MNKLYYLIFSKEVQWVNRLNHLFSPKHIQWLNGLKCFQEHTVQPRIASMLFTLSKGSVGKVLQKVENVLRVESYQTILTKWLNSHLFSANFAI